MNLILKINKIQVRLNYELKVITKMGFSGCRIFLVAWCLSITNLDPIRFGLLFERFLNPERISMPDFDIDLRQGRDKVIDYVQQQDW